MSIWMNEWMSTCKNKWIANEWINEWTYKFKKWVNEEMSKWRNE